MAESEEKVQPNALVVIGNDEQTDSEMTPKQQAPTTDTFYGGHGSRPNVQAENLQTSVSGNPEEGNLRLDFDNLGPVILNKDGTVSRMKNWNELTEKEKEKTLKVIQKRNAKRRAKLLADMEKKK